MPSDSDYLAAVQAGDTQAAQQMVDQAAKAAGYTIGPVYRGSKDGRNIQNVSGLKWFTDSLEEANRYAKGGSVEPVYLRGTIKEGDFNDVAINPDRLLSKDTLLMRNAPALNQTPRQKAEGISALPARKNYVVSDLTQIKSADPITRDDSGNVIPLSQRFQQSSADIRYMPQTDRAVTRAVNINDSTQDFTGQILRGEKVIETRDTLNNALQGVLGQRIGITRTGTGDTKVVGYATVAKQPIVYRNESEFRRDQNKHLVAPGSRYDIKKGGVKYGYELTDVTPVEPFAPRSVGRKYSVIDLQLMPQPDPSVPGAYSVTGGFRILPGKTGGRLRVYGPSGALVGIAGSLDEAQRMIRRKTKSN